MAARRNKTSKSFKAASRRIRAAAKNLDAIVPSGLRMIGEEVMTDVRASRPGAGVPRDEGNLAASLRVEGGGKIARAGRLGSARVSLKAGGSAAPYALYVHEMIGVHHPLGEARYLVRGLERWRPGGSAAIKALADNAQAAVDAARVR